MRRFSHYSRPIDELTTWTRFSGHSLQKLEGGGGSHYAANLFKEGIVPLTPPPPPPPLDSVAYGYTCDVILVTEAAEGT